MTGKIRVEQVIEMLTIRYPFATASADEPTFPGCFECLIQRGGKVPFETSQNFVPRKKPDPADDEMRVVVLVPDSVQSKATTGAKLRSDLNDESLRRDIECRG
jgi:hypothetical protein